MKTLTTNPLTARCSALSVKSCLCSNALLGVFAYVQWSHRDKFKQQIQRWNLLVFCKYKGNEWILWLIIDGYYLNLGKRKAEVKINAPAKSQILSYLYVEETIFITNFRDVIEQESENKITAHVIKWSIFHKTAMNVYLIWTKVENRLLDRKENNKKIRDKRI